MPACRHPALLVAGATVLATLCGHAHAQQIVLTNSRALDFGRFVAGAGGTVIVDALGVRSRTGAVVLLNSPNVGRAMFNVSKSSNGATNKAIIITLPANGSVRLNSGANSMAVGNFVANPATLLTVPNGGTTMSVGATLTVAPNQPPGTYSGSFPLTVNYQ